jgi:hypothetical protein
LLVGMGCSPDCYGHFQIGKYDIMFYNSCSILANGYLGSEQRISSGTRSL